MERQEVGLDMGTSLVRGWKVPVVGRVHVTE